MVIYRLIICYCMKEVEWTLQKLKLSFNKRTSYDSVLEQTFDYLNTMKNRSPKAIFPYKSVAKYVNRKQDKKMKTK